jgi:transcriptional regulator with XRE-family HTH domain
MKINSELVKRLRIEKNWSQEQLSEACGLSVRTIQRLENTGKGSIESVRVLAAVFGLEPNELILLEEEEPLTPIDAIKSAFIKFADFSGTASRFEYWWFLLFVLLVAGIATVIGEAIVQIISLIILVPFVAVGTRRLNDVGQSGWWQLMFLVPFGMVIVFFMMAQESKANASQPGAESLKTA